jgi:hypothetical protein
MPSGKVFQTIGNYSWLGATATSRSRGMVFYLWYISYVHAYRINIANPIKGFVLGSS